MNLLLRLPNCWHLDSCYVNSSIKPLGVWPAFSISTVPTMPIKTYHTAVAFLKDLEPHLLLDEPRHNMLLGRAYAIRNNPNPPPTTFVSFLDPHGAIVLAGFVIENGLLVVSNMGAFEDAQMREFVEVFEGVNGVFGPKVIADEVARVVGGRKCAEERLFVLEEITRKDEEGVGMFRAVTTDGKDVKIMVQWMDEFIKEAIPWSSFDPVAAVKKGIEKGDMFFWIDEEGRPASFAMKNRKLRTTICIGPVYTPPDQRGKGYATKCVAALSQHCMDEGWRRCCLFADLSNPASNRVYKKIGYCEVEDFSDWRLESAGRE